MIITQDDRFFNYRLRAFYMLISLLNLDNSSEVVRVSSLAIKSHSLIHSIARGENSFKLPIGVDIT